MRGGLSLICGMIAFVFGIAAVVVWPDDPNGGFWLAVLAAINGIVAWRGTR